MVVHGTILFRVWLNGFATFATASAWMLGGMGISKYLTSIRLLFRGEHTAGILHVPVIVASVNSYYAQQLLCSR